MKTILISVLITAALLAACSPKSSESTAVEKPKGVLTDAQKQALEKAKKTDEMIQEATEKRMKEADQ